MAEESTVSAVQIHPKVAIPLFAGALANVVLSVLAGAGIVLPINPADLVLIITGIVGYLVPSQ